MRTSENSYSTHSGEYHGNFGGWRARYLLGSYYSALYATAGLMACGAVIASSVGPLQRGSRRRGSPLKVARCCFLRGAANRRERRTSAAAETTTRAPRARKPRGRRRCPRAGRSLPAASHPRRRSGCRTSRRRSGRLPMRTRTLWAARLATPPALRGTPRRARPAHRWSAGSPGSGSRGRRAESPGPLP